MTYMPLRTVTIDLGNLRGQIFSRTEFAPSAVSRSRLCLFADVTLHMCRISYGMSLESCHLSGLSI